MNIEIDTQTDFKERVKEEVNIEEVLQKNREEKSEITQRRSKSSERE